ncbi:MAG: hypothetical protein ABIT04_13545 [Novosphingobium sp.]
MPAFLPDGPAQATPVAPEPTPPTASAEAPLELRLDADRLSLSLVYATLTYRLTVTNAGDSSAGPFRLAADLISAHASLETRHQLSLDTRETHAQHELGVLAPGESVTLAGDLRLALADILPIRSARANLFIPLARFRIEPRAPGAAAITRAFAVGQSGATASDALRPVNLDLGPRTIRELDQRALTVPG